MEVAIDKFEQFNIKYLQETKMQEKNLQNVFEMIKLQMKANQDFFQRSKTEFQEIMK